MKKKPGNPVLPGAEVNKLLYERGSSFGYACIKRLLNNDIGLPIPPAHLYSAMLTNDSSPVASTAQVTELAKVISDAAQRLDSVCTRHGFAFPSLDEPFTPQSEAFRYNPDANEAANIIAAAAFQLLATVMPPPASMLSLISGVSSNEPRVVVFATVITYCFSRSIFKVPPCEYVSSPTSQKSCAKLDQV